MLSKLAAQSYASGQPGSSAPALSKLPLFSANALTRLLQ